MLYQYIRWIAAALVVFFVAGAIGFSILVN